MDQASKKGIIATTHRAAKSRTCRKTRIVRTALGRTSPEKESALPGRAAELPPARSHGQAPAGELVDLFPDLAADVLGQRSGRVVKSRNHLVGRRRAVVKKSTTLVPDERPVARIHPVAELEQRHLLLGRPDEKVEKIVVKPTPVGRWVVGDPVNLFEHIGSLTEGTPSRFACPVGKRRQSVAGAAITLFGSTVRRPARSGNEGHAIQRQPGVTKGNCGNTGRIQGLKLALTKE